MAAFKPIIEPKSPTAFLTAHPLTSISEQAIKTPLLLGLNHDDGAMKTARMKSIFICYFCSILNGQEVVY